MLKINFFSLVLRELRSKNGENRLVVFVAPTLWVSLSGYEVSLSGSEVSVHSVYVTFFFHSDPVWFQLGLWIRNGQWAVWI